LDEVISPLHLPDELVEHPLLGEIVVGVSRHCDSTPLVGGEGSFCYHITKTPNYAQGKEQIGAFVTTEYPYK
jgi:hypothetical protein